MKINKPKGNKAQKGEDKEFNIEEIRTLVANLQKTFNWYGKRSLLPYDWVTYAHPNWYMIMRECRVNPEGTLKKKDKRGHWR